MNTYEMCDLLVNIAKEQLSRMDKNDPTRIPYTSGKLLDFSLLPIFIPKPTNPIIRQNHDYGNFSAFSGTVCVRIFDIVPEHIAKMWIYLHPERFYKIFPHTFTKMVSRPPLSTVKDGGRFAIFAGWNTFNFSNVKLTGWNGTQVNHRPCVDVNELATFFTISKKCERIFSYELGSANICRQR